MAFQRLEEVEMTMEPDARLYVDRIAKDLRERPGFGLAELVDEVNDYLRTEELSIFVVDPSTRELVLTHAAGPVGQKIIGLRMPEGQGVVGWVVRYSEDLIVPSTVLDPRFFSGVDQKTGFVTRSILCAPMVRAGQSIGAIEAMNKMTGHFNADDVLLLRAVADVAVDYV